MGSKIVTVPPVLVVVVVVASPACRHRRRASVALVVQTIASPVTVTPVEPWPEQNAPGVTVVCPLACPAMMTTATADTAANTARLTCIRPPPCTCRNGSLWHVPSGR